MDFLNKSEMEGKIEINGAFHFKKKGNRNKMKIS